MNTSLKIGIVAGLIAGFVQGIIAIIIAIVDINSGLIYWHILPPPNIPISTIASIEFPLQLVYGLIYGVILGIIYCKAYGVIPGKGILKAMLFSLFLYAIFNLRFATITAAYGNYHSVFLWIIWGPFLWIPFGIVLGFFYEFLKFRYNIPKEKQKIIKYNMESAILPGAIAGLVGGMATFLTIYIGLLIGYLYKK